MSRQVRAAVRLGQWPGEHLPQPAQRPGTSPCAPPSEAEVPADLRAAIAADPAAQAMFDVLTGTNRFALIGRVNAVKRAETRTRKVAERVAMLARDETIHPQRARPAEPPTS